MSVRRHIAPIRFGYGLRLGEAPPADPVAWLEGQLDRPGPPPEGVDTAESLRVAFLQSGINSDRRRAEAEAQGRAQVPEAAAMAVAAATPPRSQDPLPALLRAEQQGALQRRLRSAEPFRERLVDFWMNHFTVSRRNPALVALPGPFEREAIRPHVTGRFADMLAAVVRHPAMLLYLDNHASVGPGSATGRAPGPGGRRRGLNENLAREILELHTLSPAGGYTQGDVGELARILTGWSVAREAEPFGFAWRPRSHEPGAKSLLGRTIPEGPEGVEAALRLLGTHPATYRHLAVKLARHFVADAPPPAAVRAVEQALTRTEGDLGEAARALVRGREAWDPPLSKFRTPADFVLAAMRAVGLDQPERALAGMAQLGQPLWMARQPDGWSDLAEEWLGPEALMRRVDWAYTLAGQASGADLAAVVEAALGPLARAGTVSAMRGAGSPRDALTLLFGSPEFQHR